MRFDTSPAPHVIERNSVRRVMLLTLIALVPGTLAHMYFFGAGLPLQILIATAAALLAEAISLRLRQQPLKPYLTDGSAIVTAVLLAFALPPLAPWWLGATGAAFGIVVGKQLFGGLGRNLFNPAMVGYAVLIVSFPAQMSAWSPPAGVESDATLLGFTETLRTILTAAPPSSLTWDSITAATPLDTARAGLAMGQTMEEIHAGPLFGTFSGHGWDWVSAAILLGGLALLAWKVIRWHIPVAMLATIALLASMMHAVDPGNYSGVLFHLAGGATILGAFFIACDPVTAAASDRGRLIYGAGIGALTYFIRAWGDYPDGVAFAVLLMNMLVPLIDRYSVPRIYGHARES